MKITKTKEGTYSVVLYNNGIRKHITAKSYSECKNKATEWLNSKVNVSSNKLLVKDAIANYININSNILSPTTIRSYIGISRNYFQELMCLKLVDLNQQNLQRSINELSTRISPKTTRNAFALMSSVLKQNDMQVPKVHLPQKVKSDIYIPTKEEVKQLIDESAGTLHDAILLGAYLGLRRSEICALQPSDIYDNVVHIRKALVKGLDGWEIKTTKTTESSRDLPLPKACQSVTLPISATPNRITQEFDKLRDQLNIPIRFHDLRHYFVSQLIANNIPNAYIRSYTGHSSDRMINQVYGHLLPEKKKEVISVLEKVFE